MRYLFYRSQSITEMFLVYVLRWRGKSLCCPNILMFDFCASVIMYTEIKRRGSASSVTVPPPSPVGKNVDSDDEDGR